MRRLAIVAIMLWFCTVACAPSPPAQGSTSLFGGEVQQQRGDALIEAWRKLLTPIVTQHLLGPIDVDVSGDSATARCHVRGYHYAKSAPGGDEWMVAGHCIFRAAQERWGMEDPRDEARDVLPVGEP